MTPRIVYIVDDNAEFLSATRFWLDGIGYEVHCWSDPVVATAALSQRDRARPACLLLDVRMPGMTGLDLHDCLLGCDAALPIIYMSGHADVPLAVQAMQKGAVTLLEKPFDEAALEIALDHAFRLDPAAPPGPRTGSSRGADTVGHGAGPTTGAGPAAVGALAGAGAVGVGVAVATPVFDDPATTDARTTFVAREARLTPRERQVLALVIEGIYNKNIADRIGLSIKTVELYRSRGMAKMQARSVAELTRMMVTGRVG